MRGPVGSRLRLGAARCVLAVVFGLVSGLSVAVPVFAADGTIQPRVVGGEPVPSGDFRFVASLGDARNGLTAYGRHFCGASLIDRNSVLTAAHCVRGARKRPLRVVVGRTVLSGGGGQTRRVARISIHPKFGGVVSVAYDAAVLTLKTPVKGISPIKLAGAAQDPLERPGHPATIAGWGNTIKQPPRGNNGAHYPDWMRVARVTMVSDTTARKAYGALYVGALMVAAGEGERDACDGDSGGPMFVSMAGKRYQIGITSFGKGCASRTYPGAYTEVNAGPIRRFIVHAAGL